MLWIVAHRQDAAVDAGVQCLDTAVEYYNIESPSLGDQFLLEVLLASVALI